MIRDEMDNWKKEALMTANEVQKALAPILEKALERGLTHEDFVYIAVEESTSVVNMNITDKRRAQRNKPSLFQSSPRSESREGCSFVGGQQYDV